MHFQRILRLSLIAVTALVLGGMAQILQAEQQTQANLVPGYLVPLYAKSTADLGRVLPTTDQKNRIQSANITVTYNGFTPEARNAFQYAVDIWASEISSPIPIHIEANWSNLGSGILGMAGPTNFVELIKDGQRSYYPIALASKLNNMDYSQGFADVQATFNSALPLWYFGTDGNTPISRYDFVSVVLHELGHGLGFIGGFNLSGSSGNWYRPQPFIYDRFTVDGSGNSLIDTSLYPNGSSNLGSVLKSDSVYFTGQNAMQAAGGERIKLYAPPIWSEGSSYSHLDELTYYTGSPNALMTPSLDDGEVLHDVGAITRGIFKDMGWIDGTEQPMISPTPSQTLTPSITRTPIPPGTIFENYLPYIPKDVPTSQATMTPTTESAFASPTPSETQETPTPSETQEWESTLTATATKTQMGTEEPTETATATVETEESPTPSNTAILTVTTPPDGSPTVTPTRTVEITSL